MSKPEALRLAECLERDCEMNWPDYDNQMNAAAELRRLHAEVEALRADVGRYRFIKDYDNPDSPLAICTWSDVGWSGEWVIEHEPDAVIDAAMAKEQTK